MLKTNRAYIDKINSPKDLRKLTPDELKIYCGELRKFIIDELATNPGHLGSSLGTVELATAIHYTFDTPYDKVVWDVGHQAYPHKIITGRRDVFNTNRKMGGISGFPVIAESEYDTFGVGHASTSISAALGIATSSRLKDERRQVVAVIGDGSLTGGLAFEGLNNAGGEGADMLVILNDNHIAIDKNVGALREYLLDMTTSWGYNMLKSKAWKMLSGVPRLRKFLSKFRGVMKSGLMQQSNLFEAMGFRYFGPINGNDVESLSRVLKDLKEIKGPKLLHVMTVKGYGYQPAEKDPCVWHAPGKFDPETGVIINTETVDQPPKYQDVFGLTVVELAEQNENIVGITPAMPSGCSLNIMMAQMPERCFDVGIAEAHAVTFAAGMATNGTIPFCNIYSSFLQRAYDNIIHDVALQNLDVIFCIDRAGLVGEDGATHQGVFDIASLRIVPNMTISAPMNEIELRNLMYTAQLGGKGPFVIRYPRGRGVTMDWRRPFEEIQIGKGRLLKEGGDTIILSLGHPGNFAAEAIERAKNEGVTVAQVDLRFAKPLDTELLDYAAKNYKRIITLEDGVVAGGVGSAIAEYLNSHSYKGEIVMLGVPDSFIPHGTPEELRHLCGFDTDGIYNTIMNKTE